MAQQASIGIPASRDQHSVRVSDLEGGVLAGAVSLAVTMSAIYFEEFTTSRLLIVLLLLFFVQLLRSPVVVITREIGLYASLVAYLSISLLWTPDPVLGLNTIFPAFDFLVVSLSYASLVRNTDVRAVVTGALTGLIAGALVFAVQSHFPFSVPVDFSYNAFAMMYFGGLILTLLVGVTTRSRLPVLLLAIVFVAHVTATTSIKTNLGIVVGALAVVVLRRQEAWSLLRRFAVPLALGVCALVYSVLSNPLVMARLQYAFDRLWIGLEVLQTREDHAGYTGFNERAEWARAGLAAWRLNPVFGHGVEAFRVPFGITSHSTPIDLLYNTGLIGLLLFYGMLASLALRCIGSPARSLPGVRAAVLFGVTAFAFISLSGTLFYQTFLAILVGIGSGILASSDRRTANP
jgi:hypothetical protein